MGYTKKRKERKDKGTKRKKYRQHVCNRVKCAANALYTYDQYVCGTRHTLYILFDKFSSQCEIEYPGANVQSINSIDENHILKSWSRELKSFTKASKQSKKKKSKFISKKKKSTSDISFEN